MSVADQDPGEEVERHENGYEEAYCVLQGEGIMAIGDLPEFTIKHYDCIYTPENTLHWAKSTGDEPLVLLCSITPPPIP